MKCPKCQKEMEIKKEDVSFNSSLKQKKEYSRKVYFCKDDDVWVTVEISLISSKIL